MAGYVNLPQFEVPGNALLNFAPVNNAIANYGQTSRALEQEGYDRQRQAVADQRQAMQFAQQQKDRVEDRLGNMAINASKLPKGDPRRGVILQRILSQHPDANGLAPEYKNPDTAFDLIAADYGKFRDPQAEEAQKLELDYKRAQINKLNKDATEAGSQYGKSGAVVKGEDGNYYAVRYSADGTERINRLQVGGQGVTPDRGTDVVGDTVIDKATGREVRNIGPAIAGGETAKIVGRETGEGRINLPKAKASLDQYAETDKIVNADIDRAIELSKGLGATGMAGQMSQGVGGTPAYNLKATLTTIKGNIGFDKLQSLRDNSPTGGALGQVAVQELEALQSVLGSLDQAQSQEQLQANLQRLKDVRARYRGLKEQAYQRDVARFGAAAVPNPNEPSKAQPPAPAGLPDGWSYNGAR